MTSPQIRIRLRQIKKRRTPTPHRVRAHQPNTLQTLRSPGNQSPVKSGLSFFDRAKINKPDFLILPAGTEIRVDIVDGKVIVPVRVGFATPIPALSRAEVTVNRKYYAPYNVSYDVSGTYAGMYTENAELASVTVDSVAYPVKATVVPLNGVAAQPASIPSTRDVTFVLTAPLAIRR